MDRVWCIPEFTYGPTKEFCRSSLYFQTLQACWEETYYNKQKKLMVHYLLLQSQGQVPPHVTTEHMSNWLVSQGKKSLRERVWKETLEEGNDLARLAWEVNICLKMMDIEHEAFCKLRRSMHSTSAADIDPKVHIIVERAVGSILDEQSNEPRSNLLSPSQVVVEVVPRLLLALWLQPEEGHSEHPILISGMAVGMVAAVVEKLSCLLKDPSPHIHFSRAAAFDSVRSILGRISQSFSTDDLQSPFYMSSVCAFVVDEVQSCFQPPAATLPVPPVLAVAVFTTLPADIQADQASSHLEVVNITPNTEADPGSSHLDVVDITPKTKADPGSSHLEVVDITPKTKADPASSHMEVVDITPNTEADPASSHLNVVDITPNTEADPASSHLNVVDITPNTEADPASSHLNVVDITTNKEADPASSHLNVVDITTNTEADPASSILNVVDITPNTEAEPISSHLEVVDVTPEERNLTMAVFATLPADIQAEDVAVVIPDVTPHVTKDVTLDVPCRARKGAVRRLFCRLWRAVCCCACHKEEEEQY
ncbi:uncharacterized protein LOC129863663 isoform X2 [Salvelinus fontinalis]|uniref:uncharacterized protein LOC129863663 isoform X2 n=1 Tax=Salvelinus fontinalis TaxID=8038 RepID=UPI0024867CF2|nr:uncharacterized protein LOC129863663 isoform X2 [Salvelinus fontinalis]